MKKNEIQLKDEMEKHRKTHGFAEELMETEETKEAVNSAVTMWAETEGNIVNSTEGKNYYFISFYQDYS